MSQSRKHNKDDYHIKDFSYTSTREQHGHARRQSFGTIGCKSGVTYHYNKTKFLGEGGYGAVSLMSPTAPSLPRLVVKEFQPQVYGGENASSLAEAVRMAHQMCLYETKMYHRIGGGIAFSFQSHEPYKVEEKGGVYNLISYPHSYMLMDYIDGTLFYKFTLESYAQFFSIFTQTLLALEAIHRKGIIHRDIKGDNVFICKDSSGAFKVRFIDTSLTKNENEPISTYAPHQRDAYPHLPPEYFQSGVRVNALKNQDIYEVGSLLLNFFLRGKAQGLFLKEVADDIQCIISQMMHKQPENRISLSGALELMEKLEETNTLVSYFQQELNRLEQEFPQEQAINKWCFCAPYIINYVKINNPHHSEYVSGLKRAQKQLQSRNPSYFLTTDLIAWLRRELIKNDATSLEQVISLLRDNNSIMALIEALCLNDKTFLAHTFLGVSLANEFIGCLSIFGDVQRFHSLLLKSNLVTYEIQATSKDVSRQDTIETMDKWYFCQALLHRLHDEHYWMNIKSQYDVLNRAWVTKCGLNELKLRLATDPAYVNDILSDLDKPHRESFARYLAEGFVDYSPEYKLYNTAMLKEIINLLHQFDLIAEEKLITKNMVNGFFDKHTKFSDALSEIDQFENDIDLYKRLLLISNRIYREKRIKDGRAYLSMFGRYNLEDKKEASLRLARFAKRGHASEAASLPDAALEGKLGEIGIRLKKVV